MAASLAALVVAAVLTVPPATAGGTSAADAQYFYVAPITKPRTARPKAETASKSAPKGKSPLPFTGLSLLAPVVFSLALLGGGVALRRKFATRRPRA